MKKIIMMIMMVFVVLTFVGCSSEPEQPKTLWMKPRTLSQAEIQAAKARYEKEHANTSKEYEEESEYNSRTNDWSK